MRDTKHEEGHSKCPKYNSLIDYCVKYDCGLSFFFLIRQLDSSISCKYTNPLFSIKGFIPEQCKDNVIDSNGKNHKSSKKAYQIEQRV